MGDLVVITGPPGAGKSAVARIVADAFEPSVLVTGDAFFAFLARGAVAPWLPEAHAQNAVVTEAAALAAGRLTRLGTAVYDGMIGPWFLPTFATASGVRELHYAMLLPAESVCLRRVSTRVGHGFRDLSAARHMYREFAVAEVDARHVLTDPPGEPATVAAEVVERLGRGELRWAPPRLPTH